MRDRSLRALLGIALLSQIACLERVPTSIEDKAQATARALVARVVYEMETKSYRRDSIDWPAFRDTVAASIAGAESLEETHPALQLALTLLGDDHSWLRTPSDRMLRSSRPRSCGAAPAPAPAGLPADIGYVRVGAFAGSATAAAAYIAALQAAMQAADGGAVVGWIVDLRGNTGGNMWPMLAALSPFLQGQVGHFVTPDSTWTTWSVTGSRAFLDATPLAEAPASFVPSGSGGRIAILTDGLVASSGEATAIAFRGRPGARSFGTATCGLSTAVGGIAVGAGYTLGLASAVMADRDSVIFGGPVAPDETIGDAATLVARAIDWIRAGTTPH